MLPASAIQFAAVIAIVAAACTATPVVSPGKALGTPSARPAAVTTPPSVPPPATSRPTPLALPTANALRVEPYVRPYATDGGVLAQVIVAVANQSGDWVEIDAGRSQYTILDPGSAITATGTFDTAAPSRLPPGEIGYLVGAVTTAEHGPSDFDRVEVDVSFREGEFVGGSLTVEDTGVQILATGGVEVSGQVYNGGSELVDEATVVAILVDLLDEPMGFVLGHVEHVAPGAHQPIQFQSTFADIRLAHVLHTNYFIAD